MHAAAEEEGLWGAVEQLELGLLGPDLVFTLVQVVEASAGLAGAWRWCGGEGTPDPRGSSTDTHCHPEEMPAHGLSHTRTGSQAPSISCLGALTVPHMWDTHSSAAVVEVQSAEGGQKRLPGGRGC